MTTLVVDSSVLPKWWFNEVHRDEALLLLGRDITLLAPDILVPELLNMLVQKRRRGASEEVVSRALDEIPTLPVALRPSARLGRAAVDLAGQYHPSAYDCLYAALALAEDCPVVTADRRFYEALHPAYPASLVWIEDLPAFIAGRR